LLYSFHITLLVIFASDGKIMWYESMIFVILYFCYFIVMFSNRRISSFFKWLVEDKMNCCRNRVVDLDSSNDCSIEKGDKAPKTVENNNVEDPKAFAGVVNTGYVYSKENLNEPPTADPEALGNEPFHHHAVVAPHVIPDEEDEEMKLFEISRESTTMTIWWFYTWPLRLVCACIIPDCRKHRRWYPLTFIMCMFVLAANSYMVVWMVTIVGFSFNIPEAVMGLTFLAAGGCLPEAASAIIMARKGDGAMGVSNSLGSNSLAVLFSLGLPWFLRTMVNIGQDKQAYITIYNNGIEFTILLLLLAVVSLYLIISCNGYRLKRIVGASLIGTYACFVTVAILMNMGIIGNFGPSC